MVDVCAPGTLPRTCCISDMVLPCRGDADVVYSNSWMLAMTALLAAGATLLMLNGLLVDVESFDMAAFLQKIRTEVVASNLTSHTVCRGNIKLALIRSFDKAAFLQKIRTEVVASDQSHCLPGQCKACLDQKPYCMRQMWCSARPACMKRPDNASVNHSAQNFGALGLGW